LVLDTGRRGAERARVTLPRPSYFLPAILFALWLGMLLLGGPHTVADASLAALFHYPALVPAGRMVTLLGDWPVLLPLTAAATVILFLAASPRRALLFLAIVLSGRVLVEVQKIELARQRPDISARLAHVTSLSFPSAHAAYSMITWLAFVLLLAPPPRRTAAVAAAVAIALTVGLTRLVLHVHWPSDVIGGWAFGAGWTLLLVRLAAGTASPRPH
jgi:undecaprenyl-diphosphatase